MSSFLGAIELVTHVDVFVAVLLGAIGGCIIGIIPGVGAAVAISILLPLTFAMQPLTALTLLLGVYGASMYGGAIPAILINTPGTAVNAMTTYDGYPLTQQGHAKKALSIAYTSSFYGGVFSTLVLIVITPLVADIAPLFGSREILLAATLGLILVIIGHRGHELLAAILVGFGIFLNTIGLESLFYSQRFVFGQSWLTSGINLIVVVLGLLAISQAFVLLLDNPITAKQMTTKKKPSLDKQNFFSGILETLQHKRVSSVSACIGSLMGMLPGVGEFTAQFMSYTYAQKSSKQPELFGKGSAEGLIASETSNNAVPAAAMVPLLALGIPGETLTALMLSVFYIHNIVPGPQLFQSHLDFVYGIYILLFLINILVFVFLLSSTRFLLYILHLPSQFIGICILCLSFVGVYSIRNSFSDCVLAIVFGILGYALKRVNGPVSPIIIGMILGGIIEIKLRSSLPRLDSFMDLINRPISASLFALIMLILVWHIYAKIKQHTSRHS